MVLLGVPLVAAGGLVGAGHLAARDARWRVVIGLGGLAALAAIDQGAPSDPRASLGERALAVGLVGVIGMAWTSGVWREVVRGDR